MFLWRVLLIIEWYIMMTILPCRTKIINFHREIFTSGLLCEEVHHILFSSLLLPEERPVLADLLTSSQFKYHLKLRNIFNTTTERKYILYNYNKKPLFDAIYWMHYNYVRENPPGSSYFHPGPCWWYLCCSQTYNCFPGSRVFQTSQPPLSSPPLCLPHLNKLSCQVFLFLSRLGKFARSNNQCWNYCRFRCFIFVLSKVVQVILKYQCGGLSWPFFLSFFSFNRQVFSSLQCFSFTQL